MWFHKPFEDLTNNYESSRKLYKCDSSQKCLITLDESQNSISENMEEVRVNIFKNNLRSN